MGCRVRYRIPASLAPQRPFLAPVLLLRRLLGHLSHLVCLTSRSRCSARSFLIFSSSRSNSAVSSSSSLPGISPQIHQVLYWGGNLSSSLPSLPDPSESASISLVSSRIRLLLASVSSSMVFPLPLGPASSSRFPNRLRPVCSFFFGEDPLAFE